MLAQELPVHHSDTLVLEHRVLRGNEIEQAFFSFGLGVLLQPVKCSTPYLVRVVKELLLGVSGERPSRNLLLLVLVEPPVVD